MSFIWPIMLVLLVLVPLLVALYIWLQRRRRQLAARYSSLGFVQQSAGRTGWRRHVPIALFLFGVTILLIALARPQAVVSLPKQEGTVILAFDVSGSMAADDMKPTRMDAAKAAAQDFVQRQPLTVQIGVASFSDGGVNVQTPTNDQEAVLAAINRLTPQRGASIGQGILASLSAIAAEKEPQGPRLYSNLTPTPTPTPTPVPKGTYIPAVIILLTDGSNNEAPDPLAAAQAAANYGVRIYTVGIGSVTGTTLHINGFTVHTELNEEILKQIAQITGGTYYNAEDQQELLNIYDSLDPQLTIKPEQMEVTSIFAGVGIISLLLGGMLSMLWFNRLP
jgi:Ca-activated chloride channel family protein